MCIRDRIISAKILDFPQICKQKTQYCQSALRCGCVDGARRRGAVAKKCPAPRGGRAPGYILSEAVTSLPLIGFLFRFLKCAPLHVTNMRSVRISASGGDDDRRRAFPPPRQAVAAVRNPVFRHAGSWRHAGRAKSLLYTIAPRRWCGAVLPPWIGVYHLVYHMVVWCNDGLPPPPGWHIWDAVCGPRMSPTPRSAKYGATHSANRLPGLEITSPLVRISTMAE